MGELRSIYFFDRAISNGISKEDIIIEANATNFGQDISLSKVLLPNAQSATFISKPNSLLRVKLAVDVQWPKVNLYVAYPAIIFPDDVSNVIGVLGVINEMVGDIGRIVRYPEMGFQAVHQLPEEILTA